MDYLFRDDELLDPFAIHKRQFDDSDDVEKASFKLVSGQWWRMHSAFKDEYSDEKWDFGKHIQMDWIWMYSSMDPASS